MASNPLPSQNLVSSQPSMFQSIREYLNNTPLITRYCLFVSIVGLVLGILGISPFFANCPVLVINSLHIYRPFLCFLFPLNLFGGIFSLILVFSISNIVERQKGSIFTLIYLFISSFIIHWAYVIISYIFIWLFKIESSMCVAGLWPTAFSLLVVECSFSDSLSTRRFFCLPLDIQLRYFPMAFLLLFTLLSGFSMVSFIGLLFGYFYIHIIKKDNSRIESLANLQIFSILINMPGFLPYNANEQTPSFFSSPPSSSKENITNVSHWTSSKGHILGEREDSDPLTNPNLIPLETNQYSPINALENNAKELSSHCNCSIEESTWALRESFNQIDEARKLLDTVFNLKSKGFITEDIKWALKESFNLPNNTETLLYSFFQHVEEMKKIGYTEEDAKLALRYSRNNVESAIKFMSGQLQEV